MAGATGACAPALVDPGYTTVMNSSRIVQECLTGIAMRKAGITDGDYLNPLTVDDDVPGPAN